MSSPWQSSRDVVGFLLASHCIAPSAVVRDGLRLVTSRRERFALHTVHAGGAVVCLVKTALDVGSQPYLFAEGAVLALLQSDARTRGIGPLCHARDWTGIHVAMELIRADAAVRQSTEDHAAAKADVLAALHAATLGRSFGFTTTLPPVFEAVCFGRAPNRPAVARLMAVAPDRHALLAGLGRTAGIWRRQSLIHADVKAEHWLPDALNGLRLRLIDWEMVRFGDPAWDVAGVLHDYVAERHPMEAGHAAHCGLLDRPEAAAFVHRYSRAGGLRNAPADFGMRISMCMAARLVQTALETLNTGSHWRVADLLSTAVGIFVRPERLAVPLDAAIACSAR